MIVPIGIESSFYEENCIDLRKSELHFTIDEEQGTSNRMCKSYKSWK